MAMSPAPHPLPPLTTEDPASFYTIVVSGQSFQVTYSALQYDSPNFFSDSKHLLIIYFSCTNDLSVCGNEGLFFSVLGVRFWLSFLQSSSTVHTRNQGRGSCTLTGIRTCFGILSSTCKDTMSSPGTKSIKRIWWWTLIFTNWSDWSRICANICKCISLFPLTIVPAG